MKVLASVATVGAIASLAVGVFGVGPADAALNNNYCNHGAVTCMYADAGYLNGIAYHTPGTGLLNASKNDQLSSWENLTSTGARWYYNSTTDPNGLGPCVPMQAHFNATVHPGDGNPDNDQASSWTFVSSNC